MNICKPRAEPISTPTLSVGARSIHVEHRPTGRLISIPPCRTPSPPLSFPSPDHRRHPHIHVRIGSVYAAASSRLAASCMCMCDTIVRVSRARQRLRTCRGGLFRSWRACVRTTTWMYLTPKEKNIYICKRRRVPDRKKGVHFYATRSTRYACMHARARARVAFQETREYAYEEARYSPLINTFCFNIRFIIPRRDFLFVLDYTIWQMNDLITRSFFRMPFRIFKSFVSSQRERKF